MMRNGLVLAFVFVCAVTVAAPIIPCHAATAPVAAPVTTIDWSRGDIQDTPANCGEMVFKNLKDKHSYSLLVRGTTSGSCSFQADGLKFHLPSSFGPTTDGTITLFNFLRVGSDVIVTWQPGF